MSISVSEAWRLLAESRLVPAQQLQSLTADFGRLKGAGDTNAKALFQWLVSQGAITKYHAMVLAAGRSGPFVFGAYRVLDRIGESPLSGMFRAVHIATGHGVILRFLSGAAADDPDAWAELADLARRHGAVSHPHLSRCFEPVDLGSFKFAAIENLLGESVEKRLAASGLVAPQEAARIARAAAQGLAQLHQANLAHGDVRPSRLWLQPNGNVKLFRDPLAAPGSPPAEQIGGEALARADYLAPELAPGGEPGPLTDIYALGCTLFHLLAGQPPFPGGDAASKMQRHAGERIAPLAERGVPEELARLVTYLMAKNPQVRYQQALVVAEQLSPFADPAKMHLRPPAAPPSLAAYEAAIKQGSGQSPSPFSTAPPPGPSSAPPAESAPPMIAPQDASPVGVAASVMARRKGQRGGHPLAGRNMVMMIGGLGVAAVVTLALLVALFAFGINGGEADDTAAAEDVDAATGESDGTPTDGAAVPTDDAGQEDGGDSIDGEAAPAVKVNLVEDDGRTLWASPTGGGPVSLDYVPLGSQFYLAVRPADMLASPEGSRVLRALGPEFAAGREAWETASGFRLEEIEQLLISLHSEVGGTPRPFYVVRPKDVTRDGLLARWGNPTPTPEGNSAYYMVRGYGVHIPESSGGGVFVMGSPPEIKDVIERKGAPPPASTISSVLEASDRERHVNLILMPNYLFNDEGQKLFAGPRSKLYEPLRWFFGETHLLKAVSAGIHFDDSSTYLEVRLHSQLDRDASDLAKEMQSRLAEIPPKVESYLRTLRLDPHWQSVAFRFPQMIYFLHRHTRLGRDGELAVINAVLPPTAVSNIAVGTEYALASTPGQGPVAVTPTPEPKKPADIDELLLAKTSIDIPQQDLILAVQTLSADVEETHGPLAFPFEIKMMGNDLRDEGITQNQQVRNFKMENATLSEILTGMVMKANPITTVTDPSEADQKLIWVVAEDPDNAGRRIILLTTRTAATKREIPLPEPFQPKKS